MVAHRHRRARHARGGVRARGRDALKIRHDADLLTFFLVTFVAPYWASTLLHFVPWKRRVAHDVALVLDFLGIAAGFAGQTVAWTGDRWWDVFDDARPTSSGALDRVAAVAAVGATAALATILAVAVARRNRTPVMLHMRRVRFAITGFNMVMLGIVETRNVRASLNLALQLVGKGVPGYFVLCVAVDATRRGPLPLWPGRVVRARKLARRHTDPARHAVLRHRRENARGGVRVGVAAVSGTDARV